MEEEPGEHLCTLAGVTRQQPVLGVPCICRAKGRRGSRRDRFPATSCQAGKAGQQARVAGEAHCARCPPAMWHRMAPDSKTFSPAGSASKSTAGRVGTGRVMVVVGGERGGKGGACGRAGAGGLGADA